MTVSGGRHLRYLTVCVVDGTAAAVHVESPTLERMLAVSCTYVSCVSYMSYTCLICVLCHK